MIQNQINAALGIMAGSKMFKSFDKTKGQMALSNSSEEVTARRSLRTQSILNKRQLHNIRQATKGNKQ